MYFCARPAHARSQGARARAGRRHASPRRGNAQLSSGNGPRGGARLGLAAGASPNWAVVPSQVGPTTPAQGRARWACPATQRSYYQSSLAARARRRDGSARKTGGAPLPWGAQARRCVLLLPHSCEILPSAGASQGRSTAALCLWHMFIGMLIGFVCAPWHGMSWAGSPRALARVVASSCQATALTPRLHCACPWRSPALDYLCK